MLHLFVTFRKVALNYVDKVQLDKLLRKAQRAVSEASENLTATKPSQTPHLQENLFLFLN